MRRAELIGVVTFSLLVALLVGYGTYYVELTSEPNEEEIVLELAENFLRSNPTFGFDGLEESIVVGPITSTIDQPPSIFRLSINFTSSHPGYGDRTDQILAQALTDHRMDITIGRIGISNQFLVQSAEIDGVWNELNQTGFPLALNELLGQEWILGSFLNNTQEVHLDTPNDVTIVFHGGGSVSGSGGCNRYMGTYEATEENLIIGLFASTRISCPAGMEVEMLYFSALAERLSFRVTADGLVLSSTESAIVLIFMRQ